MCANMAPYCMASRPTPPEALGMARIATNPYAPGYPAPPRLFAGRRSALESIRSFFNATCEGHLNNVFIEGEWGIGKTSLLDKLSPELQEYAPVVKEDLVVSNKGDDQLAEFLVPVLTELSERAELDLDDLPIGNSGVTRSNLRLSLKVLWDRLFERHHRAVVLMLDNLERAKPEFLDDVRDIFQYLGGQGARYMLVFAGKSLPVSGVSAANPVSRFFHRLPIDVFAEDESVEAICKPLRVGYVISITDGAARLIHERAAGHPYFLKAICSAVFDLANGEGTVDPEWMHKGWPEVEESLSTLRFANEFRDLPDGEKETLLRASLLGSTFEPKELRSFIPKSLDIFLSRLSADRTLLRKLQRGEYEVYHPLFREFLRAEAVRRNMKATRSRNVPERRPAMGRDEVEEIIRSIGKKRLDVLDQHFRGRAVSFLEASEPGVKIRVLMGPDPQWSGTQRLLKELHEELRDRIEIREWPASQENPVPWHVRFVLGESGAFEVSHSLDGVGRKATYFTDKNDSREVLSRDFERWWKASRKVFPEAQ